ncbi:L-arabinose isomerase family protein [Paenibacillus daejeonensis]|uniref:L-arabinose isomerase family protein n=1 Tax=Paenibacillus daejeonensis TaxID=135193 RepID=UPI00036170EC|nr:hypothetical protein [Paenibacillus daejeonensis]
MKKLRIGLLPLYIQLYDDYFAQLRPRIEAFYATIVRSFEQRGVEVVESGMCKVRSECAEAVHRFETQGVDALVTLHLAYSPSLESAAVLAATELPVIVLDTTPTYDYSPQQDPEELMYNHGIHGVQDLCNLLLRSDKRFLLEAGHWSESDVLDRVVEGVKAARIVHHLRHARVGRLGKTFAGMGDFDVPTDVLRRTIGLETVILDASSLGEGAASAISDAAIEQEMQEDQRAYESAGVDAAVHRQSTRACLTMRQLIEEHRLTAFTVNFLDVTGQSGLSSMPFLEVSKAMGRGIGYAGEGDVLTAALVGALLAVYPETSFTEMFCPDWKHNRVFLSHMGEMNLKVCSGKPVLREMSFPFTDADNPVVAYGRFRGGQAVYVNLAPGREGEYRLILSPITMTEVEGEDRMAGSIRGWFEPPVPVADFLTAYSRQGGTHHGAIVYGDVLRALTELGELMGWPTVIINE